MLAGFFAPWYASLADISGYWDIGISVAQPDAKARVSVKATQIGSFYLVVIGLENVCFLLSM